MTQDEFEKIVAEEFSVVPEHVRSKLKNIAFIVEDEPSEETRRAEGLEKDETLLGLYHGVPLTERGDQYGVGMTLPDVITIYQKPIEKAAGNDPDEIRRVVRETIWHEVAHYFGMDEPEVRLRENKRKGAFR